jgi:fibronectin-binding autotransporter adhesin
MVRRITKTGAAPGGFASPLAHRGFGKAAAWVGGVALFCALVSTVPASAQIAGIGTDVSVPGTAVTGTATLNTVSDGGGGQGYFVANGATLTVNNSTFQNFTTSGGSGSGGGLGAGGAIFIDNGGTVVLNNTSFSHNSVIGGLGGTNSPYGGTLNGISSIPGTPNSPNGANGTNGIMKIDDGVTFGDGKGNGIACSQGNVNCNALAATNGGNGTNGYGGIGGVGAAATNGWANDPVDETNVATASIKVVADSGKVIVDGVNVTAWILAAVADASTAADPFVSPLAGIEATFKGGKATLAVIGTVADVLSLAADATTLNLNVQKLAAWNTLVSEGIAGNGGSGGTGGNGGKGSTGFGGGAGGQGGAYGLTPWNNGVAVDGTGGNGGAGGAGGFGGGGGAGGYGFGAGQNGCGSDSSKAAGGCTSSSGTGGAGGAAGFGAGVGSKGGVTGVSNASGGGGGDGYGGAIFLNSGGKLIITGNSTFNGDSALGGASLNNGAAGGAAGSDIMMMQGSTLILNPGASAGNVANVITFYGTIADNSVGSIGTSTTTGTAEYPATGGASLTVGSGITAFNGQNSYSGQTVINGGDLVNGVLNTSANTSGAPNYALTDGALKANDGFGLPTASNLNFSGPNQWTGGVAEISAGTKGASTTFTRTVSANPNPFGGGTPNAVQWTGSGGFAAFNGPLTVTLSGGAPLIWGQNGFVPVGYSLIFGSADSNASVTFTNDINIGSGTVATGTAASILSANNGNAAGSIVTMSGVISGTGDLSINGGGFNGTVNLTADNTYTGLTYVNSGTLMLSGQGSIASSSGLILLNSATLDISQSTLGITAIPHFSATGTVSLGGVEITVTNGGTFSGAFGDGGAGAGTKGSLIVAGGTLTLLGNNTYTGDTTINAGATLVLAGTGSISSSSPVIDNGTFDITQLTGQTSIEALQGSGSALIGSNELLITNGISTTTPSSWFSGVISGTGGELSIGGGIQTLSGTNTYTGSTMIVPLVTPVGTGINAVLALAGTGSIATSSQVVVAAGGMFDISQTTAGVSIQTLSGSGVVALGSQTLIVTNGSTKLEFDGSIVDGGIGGGTAGNVVLSGGTLTLGGINTYTGTTTINTGTTLALKSTVTSTGTTIDGSIYLSSNVIDNGIFDISQTSVGATIKTLSGGGQALLGGNGLLISNGSTTFSGDINDGGLGGGHGGSLGVGGGIQTLSGVNTYTGGTQIAPLVTGGTATLALSGIGSIATSSEVLVLTGGTFDISQTTAGASIQTLTGNGKVALGGQELTITNGSPTANGVFAGVLSDGGIGGGTKGSLIVSGGTQTLAGVNTYTGDTTIAPNPAGGTATLALAGNGSIATSSMVAIATGGTFDISQTGGAQITTLADSGAKPSGSVKLGAQTLAITNGSTTFSGVISDGGIGNGTGGNFAVTGGTQTLAGVNTYTGVTAIMPNPAGGSATLALFGNGSVATSSMVFIDNGGTFDISHTAAGASITTLSGNTNASVALGGKTLTITAGGAGADGSNPAGNFFGVISGAGGVAITGGHQEFLGQNTYTGGTQVTNAAILSINNSASLGAASSTLTLNNGMLAVDASITIPQPVQLLGAPPGTDLINLNNNNVTLSGAITGPGVLTIANGTLNLTGTVNGIGGIVLGPGVTFTATTTANAGIGTTPIVLVPTSGAAVDLFTGTVHVVGPLDVINGATPELIIQPGEQLAGVGSVNAQVIVQSGGSKAPGDGPGTIFANAGVINLPGSTYTVEIDGPLNSATNCTNPIGCAGQYSSVVVLGGNTYTANGVIMPILRGIAPPANNNYTAPVGSSYTAVYAQGGVLGSFTSLTQPAAGAGLAKGTRFDALYFNINAAASMTSSALTYAQNSAGNPTAVNLWVTPSSYQKLQPWNVSLAQNQNQVAYALDALRGVNDLNPAASLPAGLKNNAYATWDFGQLFPQQPASLPGIFNQLSGEVAADAKLVSFQMTNEFLNMMLDSSLNGRHGGTGALAFASDEPTESSGVTEQAGLSDAALGYAQAAKSPTPAANFDQRWSTWASAFGHGLNASGDAAVGSSSLTAHMYGAGGGFDYRWSQDTVLGVAVAGGSTNWSVAQSLGTGRSDVFEGGVYGSTRFGSVYLAGAASAANHWMATDRMAFASDHLQSSFNAQSYGGRVEAGWRYVMPWVTATPYVAGTAQRYSTPTYNENDLIGGGFGLQYASSSATEIRGEVGARLDSRLAVSSDATLILRGRGAYAYQTVNNPALLATFEAALAPGALPGSGVGFTVNGAVLPKNLALASAGAELRFTSNWSVAADFRGEFGSGSVFYSGTGSVKYGW